jgi:opacity protein-like surface antigen
MIKKIFLPLFLSLVLPMTGYAEIPKALTGFGLGAKLHANTSNSTVKRGYYTNHQHKASDTTHLSGSGAFGGIFASYNHIFTNCVYLGAEISASWGKMDGKMKSKAIAQYPHALALKQRAASYGGAVKLGGLFWNALPYIKVGSINSKWHAKSTLGMTHSNKHFSKHLSGLVYGVGVEIPIHERLSFGGEMTQTHYKKLKLDHHTPGNRVVKYNIKPRHNTFALTTKVKI